MKQRPDSTCFHYFGETGDIGLIYIIIRLAVCFGSRQAKEYQLFCSAIYRLTHAIKNIGQLHTCKVWRQRIPKISIPILYGRSTDHNEIHRFFM